MSQERKIRVLVAKPGLDGHSRGAKVVAYGLRDAGFEVIYTGLHQSPLQIVNAAIQEDVDVIGLSILSGAHLNLTRRVIQSLKEKGAEDKMVVIGGVIPPADMPKLKEMGVAEVFTSGTSIKDISQIIKDKMRDRGSASFEGKGETNEQS
jgi:methylmalonyl-CoA mutase C-terminal domain/subunit